MAAIAGFYRRKLPSPPAIEFSSSEGKQLFAEALAGGTMEGFFKLISYYQTQSEPAYCGLATLSMVLNALAIDPGRKWKGWNWEALHGYLPPSTLALLASRVVIEDATVPDSVTWRPTPSGKFSVSSAYHLISADSYYLSIDAPFYRRIWSLGIPERVKAFAWLVFRGAILTNEERTRRRLAQDDRCATCTSAKESLLHLFRDCKNARELWNDVCIPLPRGDFEEPNFASWVRVNLATSVTTEGGFAWTEFFVLGLWWLWKWRNERIFQGYAPQVNRSRFVISQISEVRRARRELLSLPTEKVKVQRMIRWEKPHEGWVKINTDGAVDQSLEATAAGLIRDSEGPWRWFDDNMLDCCEPLETVKVSGIPFDKVACLAFCNGAEVEDFHTNETTIHDFRSYVISCASSEDRHLIVSYHRGRLDQTGSGHFSPIGGYHAERDLVLILDVARFKYPPHWVPLTKLWEAMDTVDESTGLHRGFMILVKPQRAPSILYTVSCRDKSWDASAKYLTKDLPHILQSEQIKDVQGLLATVMESAPADLGDLINWVAEVRMQEDGSKLSEEEKVRLSLKEEVLNQVYKTELFEHVTKFLESKRCCKLSASSNENDSLATIASEVCCQGSQIFCGVFGWSDLPCCKATNIRLLKDDDIDTGTAIVSGETDTKTIERRIDVLIPYCQVNPDGCCQRGSSNVSRKHPSVVDIVTILLLSLPPQTWLHIRDGSLRKEINKLTSSTELSPSLQQEVLHLRRQLHFLSRSLCISSP